MGVVEFQVRGYNQRKKERKENKEKAEQQKEKKSHKVTLNQFYLLLLFSDPIEATIFGSLISGPKTFG